MTRAVLDKSRGRGPKFVDHVGESSGRLLCLEWVGKRKTNGRHYWLCQCECGRQVTIMWQPGNTRSCGCLNDDSLKKRDWRTKREDGRWRLNKSKEVILASGERFESIRAMARLAGISNHAMLNRMRTQPEDMWLKRALPRGAGADKNRIRPVRKLTPHEESFGFRRQPWSVRQTEKMNRTRQQKKENSHGRSSGLADPEATRDPEHGG